MPCRWRRVRGLQSMPCTTSMSTTSRPQPPRPHEQPSTFAVATGLYSRWAICGLILGQTPTRSRSVGFAPRPHRDRRACRGLDAVGVIAVERLGDDGHGVAHSHVDTGEGRPDPTAVLKGSPCWRRGTGRPPRSRAAWPASPGCRRVPRLVARVTEVVHEGALQEPHHFDAGTCSRTRLTQYRPGGDRALPHGRARPPAVDRSHPRHPVTELLELLGQEVQELIFRRWSPRRPLPPAGWTPR